jgi:hypothetical protein
MMSADTYRLKVVDGRKHVKDAEYHNAKVEHERCQASLRKKQESLQDPHNHQAIPQYNVQLRTCLLAEEEMLALEAVVTHYAARLETLKEAEFTAV